VKHAGRTLGPYVLDQPIGRGGMGEVYRARHPGLRRDVAVKVLLAATVADSRDVERFQREGLAMSRIQHPNVVRVFDCGADGDVTWLAMELLDGASLREKFPVRAPVLDAVAIVRDLCRGLAAVHESGLIHRDVKPANVMLTRGGEVKLMDFGLVKDPDATRLTEAGEVAGTPGFLAPEVMRGAPYDHRVDVYQAGLVLYALIAGRLPHEAESLPIYIQKVCTRPAPPASEHAPGVPPRLDSVIAAALSIDPAGRPPTALALSEALDAVLVGSSRSGHKRSARVLRSGAASVPAPRPRVWPVWTSLALALLVAAVGAGVWFARTSPPAEVTDLEIEPGLRRATIRFHAPPGVDVHAALSPSSGTMRAETDESGTRRIKLAGLQPGAEYQLALNHGPRVLATRRFSTGKLLLEGIRKRVGLQSIELAWSTSVPAKTSLIWRARGQPDGFLDVPGSATTTHTARIADLDPDRDYEIRIVSIVGDGEAQEFGPIGVKLFRSALAEFLAEFERAAFQQRMLDLLWELKNKTPQQVAAILRVKLDPLRRPVELLKPICGEFFSSPSVYISTKVKVYHALKQVEGLERAVAGLKLPIPPMLTGMDWGTFYQSGRSFPPAGPPAQVAVEPREIPSSDAQHPACGAHVEEWRDADDERMLLSAAGMLKETQEIALTFPVRDPARLARAEFAVTHFPTRSKDGIYHDRMHSLELDLNGKIGLVVRVPHHDPRPNVPTVDYVGFEPSLLVEGDNVVRIHVRSCPPLRGEGARFVRRVELRTVTSR
jgi:hypothetical protein